MSEENLTSSERKLEYRKATGQYMTSSMRACFREALQLCLPNLTALGKGEVQCAPHSVQVRAIDVIGKYAIGERPIMTFQKEEWLEHVGRITAKYITDRQTFKEWGEELKASFMIQQ